MTEEYDRLVHGFLLEAIGGEKSPDVTAKVLQRTFDAPRKRLRWLIPSLAAAATVILTVGIWAILVQGGYPSPVVSGDCRIVGSEQLQRGSVIVTDRGNAVLKLGGYCTLDIGPASRLRLQGSQSDEEVLLDSGSAACDINRNIGAFAIQTSIGTVSVTGTKFSVRVFEETNGDELPLKRMDVKVSAGSVNVKGAWGSMTLRAGDQKVFGPNGPVLATRPAVATEPASETRPAVAAEPTTASGPASTTNPAGATMPSSTSKPTSASVPASVPGSTRVTITGTAKSTSIDPTFKNPAVAHATVTVTENGTQTVYYVYGWAGAICAQNDGKTVQVTGTVGESNGKKTITGRSVDVKVIVVR
ncbi:MAG: FecR domain-containing protein [Planctomycetes bacterium]|nr:FecR domain-containing protein [Planctomycetota bacterium]